MTNDVEGLVKGLLNHGCDCMQVDGERVWCAICQAAAALTAQAEAIAEARILIEQAGDMFAMPTPHWTKRAEEWRLTAHPSEKA